MPPINVIDSQGQVFSLPSEQLDAARAQGYREATAQEIAHYDRVKAAQGGTGPMAARFAEGANALTFGAFEPLLEKLAPEKAEQMKIVREANPDAATTGQIAGTVTSLLNPALGAVSKVAGKVGGAVAGQAPGAARTILAKTAEGVTAGGLVGAPKAGAEVFAGNYEEAAETLLASGALGGAFGALFGGAQVLAPAYNKLKGYASERLSEGLKNQKVKTLGAIQSDVAKLTPEKVDSIVQRADELGMFKVFQTKGSRLKQAEALAEQAGKLKTQAIDDMTAAGIQLDTAPLFSRGNKIITEKGQFENLGKAYVDAANDVMDDINKIGILTPGKADQLKMTLGPEGWDTFGRPVDSARGYVAREFYDAIKTEIIDAAERAAQNNPLAETFIKASRDYDIFTDLERWALRATNRGANQGIKLSDIGAAAVGGQLGGVSGAIKGWILNNARHEFGNAAMVRAMEGGLKAGETVEQFVSKWGRRAANGEVTQRAKVGAINAISELSGEKDPAKGMEQIVNNLSQFTTNPANAAERLAQAAGELSQGDPRVAMALQQKSIALAQALLAAAPKKLPAISPFETDSGYTSAQVRDFNKKIATVMNPLTALKDLTSGRLDAESVDLMKKVYPNLYSQMAQTVLNEAAARKKPYTYQEKLNMSIFLGTPVDTIGTPESIQAFQENFTKPEKEPNKSRKAPKIATSEQSQSERIEGR